MCFVVSQAMRLKSDDTKFIELRAHGGWLSMLNTEVRPFFLMCVYTYVCVLVFFLGRFDIFSYNTMHPHFFNVFCFSPA